MVKNNISQRALNPSEKEKLLSFNPKDVSSRATDEQKEILASRINATKGNNITPSLAPKEVDLTRWVTSPKMEQKPMATRQIMKPAKPFEPIMPKLDTASDGGLIEKKKWFTKEQVEWFLKNDKLTHWDLPGTKRWWFTKEQAESLMQDDRAQLATTQEATTTDPVTWIKQVDTRIAELEEQKIKDEEATIEWFNIAKWQFERSKWMFTNFDEINQKTEWVMKEVWDIRRTWVEPTEAQINQIATKYWINPSEVTDPQSIFERLDLTESWKTKFWATTFERWLADSEKNLERTKSDLARNVARAEADYNTQIADTERQVKESFDFGVASWVWSWANKSSAYEKGMQNIKDDWKRVVDKIRTTVGRMKEDEVEDIQRLQEDYDVAMVRSKEDFDNQMKENKFNVWLQMNWLTDKYWVWSDELTTALNKLQEKFWLDSLEAFNSYVDTQAKIQSTAYKALEMKDKQYELSNKIADRRYNEFIANDWQLLKTTTLNNLAEDVKSWKISASRYNDLKNIMQTSVIDSLNDLGTVTQSDIKTIDTLLKSWLWMSDVMAKMQESERFKKAPEISNIIDLGTKKKIVYSDWSSELVDEFSDAWLETITDSNWNKVTWTYENWKFKPVDILKKWEWADFSQNIDLQRKYPNVAAFKNNNPTGLTMWASSTLKSLWDAAWVSYWKGTARPSAEWNNYIKFATVEDWLTAYQIALTQRWDDVNSRLQAWVWTSEWPTYAANLMAESWIPDWAKFSEITDEQLNQLMYHQLKKESPWYLEEISKIETEEDKWDDLEITENDKKKLNYADNLSSETLRMNYLEENNLLDKYIEYTATKSDETTWPVEVNEIDIMWFNNSTFKPQSDITDENRDIYNKFLDEKRAVMWSKDSSIEDILKYSAWWKDLTDTNSKALSKFQWALSQLWDIQTQISSMKTWPIIWKLKGLNPYDTDAQTLKSQLTSLMPNLARWVYWEVWVLTDNDIRLYSQTIPNLTSTEDVNKAVLWMTLKVLAEWYKRELQTLAAWWKDVSWFAWLYDSLRGQVEAIETDLWIVWETTPQDEETIQQNLWFWIEAMSWMMWDRKKMSNQDIKNNILDNLY